MKGKNNEKNNQFLGKKTKSTPNKILKDQENDKNKKPSITQQDNPQNQQQQNNPNQVQQQQIQQQGTQTNQISNQQQTQQVSQNQQNSSFDKTKFDKQKNVLNEEQQAINDIYADYLKNTFVNRSASEGKKYLNSLALLEADLHQKINKINDLHQKIDKINKTNDIDSIKNYLLKCEKRNCNGDKKRENECTTAINKLKNKNEAICYVKNKHQQNVNSLQADYEKQQKSLTEKKNLLNQYNAIFFNKFDIDKNNHQFANVSVEDLEGVRCEGKINLDKLRDERAIYGKFKVKLSSLDKNTIITRDVTGDLIDDKYADHVYETKDTKKGTISVFETKNGKPIKMTKYNPTDRNGSRDKTDVTVDEIDEEHDKRTWKIYPSRPKLKDGKCDGLEKTDKYSYIETDSKGMIHVPYVNEIGQDKKVVLYSMMNDKDTKSRMQLFEKKYGDKIQLIDTEVIKDAQDNKKEILQFKNDDSKLEIGKNQTKLDIFLLKHGNYKNSNKYDLNLDVIINDIKEALKKHPNQIKEIYIKNYSCYNGLIKNNQYNFFDKFAEMIQGLIDAGTISPDVKVATSCPRGSDSDIMRQTTDGKGKYGVRAISIPNLASGESKLNLLAVETNKVAERNGRGRAYQMLQFNNKEGKYEFKPIKYHLFCDEMHRGTFQKKDHVKDYYKNLGKTSINQAPTQLQIEHTNTITI